MSRIGTSVALACDTNVRDWVRRRVGGIGHEIRVLRIASTLFAVTARWHALGAAELRLLSHAALVHDVAKPAGDKGHNKRGAAMIMGSASLPVAETERRRLAFLTRYHRGQVPAPGEEEYLHRGADSNGVLRTVLALLRAADALDSRRIAPPQFVLGVSGRMLTIHAHASGEAVRARAELGKARKFRLLEESLRCRVRMVWVDSEELQLVPQAG